MKHENNFLLYTLGSAFLLVAATMQLSVSSGSSLLAQIGRIEVVPREVSEVILYPITEVSYSEITGRVHNQDLRPMENIQIHLFETQDFPQTEPIASLVTDNLGSFVFERVPEGRYDVVIESPDHYLVKSPDPFVFGLSNSRYGYQILISQGKNQDGFDFILDELKNSQ